jgi:hypothetical protein
VASPVFKSRSGRDGNQDGPTTAENFLMCVGALLVRFGGSWRLFIHRTCTVAGLAAHGPLPALEASAARRHAHRAESCRRGHEPTF